MCNSRGDSEQTPSLGFPDPGPVSGDVVGIKSWTSARTGGGEGCLIISNSTGVSSFSSKEIKESGSSTCGLLFLFGKTTDSRLDFSCSKVILVLSAETPSSKESSFFSLAESKYQKICKYVN